MMSLSPKPTTSSLQRRDSGYDTWNTPRLTQAFVKMAESGRAKVKELLSRHSELEQSETKAQAALITVLSLTQITELKLLLDIGRQGHRFYDFVLAMLVACISLEIFIGIIIIYIGNLHYYQASDGLGFCYHVGNCLSCGALRSRRHLRGPSAYLAGVKGAHEPLRGGRSAGGPAGYDGADVDETVGCCGQPVLLLEYRLESLIDLERADGNIEFSRIKVADASVKIARASNYVKVVEDALKKSSGNAELEEELARAREDLSMVMREKDEAEAEQKLSEAQQHHAFFVKEQHEDRQERFTFRKVSFWQHMATYLLYFVMLLNVFITTFGISSGGSAHHDIGGGVSSSSAYGPLAVATALPAPSTARNSTGYLAF